MTPTDRVTEFLILAGIDRAVEKTIQGEKGKAVILVNLTEEERAAGYRKAAESVDELLCAAEEARDLTIASSKLALVRAVALGERLLTLQELFGGDFDDWLENYFGERVSRRSAFNYMKAVRYKDALGDECPDFATLKELYVAAGIMPAPESSAPGSRAPQPLFRLKFECSVGGDPARWDPIVRRDFIRQAKPVADLLERAIAAEEDL
jgi:hypothetical protein